MSETAAESPKVQTPKPDPPLSKVVRETLERSGELGKIRAMIQSKVLEVIRGEDQSPFTKPPNKNEEDVTESLREILNKLILEYFHWSGFIYSADMFATECGMENQPPPRWNLEKILGDQSKDSPILITIVNSLMKPRTDED